MTNANTKHKEQWMQNSCRKWTGRQHEEERNDKTSINVVAEIIELWSLVLRSVRRASRLSFSNSVQRDELVLKLQREIKLLGVEKDVCGPDGPVGECLVCSCAGRPAVAVGGLESEV